MKKLLLIILLAVSSFAYGQNVTVDEPFMRVVRTTPLALTTSWQTVAYSATASSYTSNSYAIDPVTGSNYCWYDVATNKFNFISMYNKIAILQLQFSTTTTLIATRATVQMRLVVPNSAVGGGDLYLPAPELGGYADVHEVTITAGQAMSSRPIVIQLPIGSGVRTNGFYVQVKLSNSLISLGVATLNGATMTISSNY